MRVLILTQHYAPEVTAGRFRLQIFAEQLAARGHEVEVVCPVPNHPRGIVEPGYRGKAVDRRREDGIEVSRVWVYARPHKSTLTRLGYYGSFLVTGSLVAAARRQADVVLASSPPLPVGVAGALAATRHRAPFVLDIRDVWPDSAAVLGELTNRRVLRILELLERWLYHRASAVVTVNQAFARHIAARTEVPSKVQVISNGTTRDWLEAGNAKVDRGSVGLPEDRFIWAYAGNIGLAQDLETALEAAKMLGDGFTLLVIGDGSRRAELERLARELPPGRVSIRGLMPAAEAARHLRAADALLVTERQTTTVSSKLYDYCAVVRPIVAVCHGEMERVVRDEDIAVPVGLGDPVALAEAVRAVRDDPQLGERLIENARRFAQENLRERQAERLADLLESTSGR